MMWVWSWGLKLMLIINFLGDVRTAMFLSSLHQIPEEELEVSNILPDHSSPLTRLHSSDKCMQVHVHL